MFGEYSEECPPECGPPDLVFYNVPKRERYVMSHNNVARNTKTTSDY
jgi:hypothetical protein